ncbi:hypothetical protein [Nonlabens ponticola]|uniref:6-bladed beta-propeller n=1 Tax=Nonlabens ponticola TaxID=2496866 RepID=A0A3S9MWC4_9FLAO|nr:hypothetical protein [Nonlabens ponticola]AZQ43442.1 hypothetical protein EJ995_04035 [Nonlabens ponticola]
MHDNFGLLRFRESIIIKSIIILPASYILKSIPARWLLGLFSLCTIMTSCIAQNKATTARTDYKLNADVFYGIDDFDNLFYSKDNVLYKRPAAGNAQPMEFYDVQLGDLTSVDLINPLRACLFYKDSQTVVLLDNRLNESVRISLNELEPYRYIEHARLAGERRLWLYNQDQQRLELYDYIQDKLIVASPVVKSQVNQMLSDYNYCHLFTGDQVITFNNYASRTGVLSTGAAVLADFDFDKLVLLNDDGWRAYRFNKDYIFEPLDDWLPENMPQAAESFYLKSGKLYIYRQNQIEVHTTNQD